MREELIDTITKNLISECKDLGLSEKDTSRIVLENPILNQIKSDIVKSHRISIDINHLKLIEGNE